MRNILHWLPPAGIAEDELIYQVKYLIYGTDKWIKIAECKNISQNWCDLSHRTYDHKELYHARVKAFLHGNCSSWAESERFNPLTDTKIDPPAFSLTSTEKSILVIVAPPEKWKRNPRDKTEYLHQIYSGLQYNVSVFNKKIKKKWMFCIKNNRLDVLLLEPNTVYCVTVQIYITPFLLSRFSKEHCIVTLKGSTFKHTSTIVFGYILPVLLIVLIAVVSSCFVCRYIHITKQKYPTNLVLKYNNTCERDNFVPSEIIVFNFIDVNIVDESPTLQKDSHLLDNGCNSTGICDVDYVEEKSSGKGLVDKRFLDKEFVFENEQDGNRPPIMNPISHGLPDQKHNDEVVVYAFDVRVEHVQEEQESFTLKDATCTLEELLHDSQKALSGSTTDDTEQTYCPWFTAEGPAISSVEQLTELLLNKRDFSHIELHDDLQVSLINLASDELNEHFCSECDVTADICLVTDQKEPFLDEKGTAFKKQQPFATAKEAEADNDQCIIVDWNPQTGRLYLPSLSSSTNDIHEEIIESKMYEEPLEEEFMSRLYEKQCSDELLGEYEEMHLLQFKEQWELHIQMPA
ncbi:interleukin-20 receptor subunit alpha-like isoform X2 [Elgaria multicarinata webbii]